MPAGNAKLTPPAGCQGLEGAPESTRRNRQPIPDAEFLQIEGAVAQEPATDVNGCGAPVVQFNILRRRVADDFVDHTVVNQAVVRLARRGRAGEVDDVVARTVG